MQPWPWDINGKWLPDPHLWKSPEVAVGTGSDTDPGCAAGKCLLLRFPGREFAPGPFLAGSHPRECIWE